MYAGSLGVVSFVVVVGALLGFFSVVVLSSRFRKIGPNQVLVIVGRGDMRTASVADHPQTVGYRLARGSAFVWPVLEQEYTLSMEVIAAEVVCKTMTTDQKAVAVKCVAQTKIGGEDQFVHAAAEQLLSKSSDEINVLVQNILRGHLAATAGAMTWPQLHSERYDLIERVTQHAQDDLARMGLVIVNLSVQEVWEI